MPWTLMQLDKHCSGEHRLNWFRCHLCLWVGQLQVVAVGQLDNAPKGPDAVAPSPRHKGSDEQAGRVEHVCSMWMQTALEEAVKHAHTQQ
jgi:hypothetical protein